MQPSNPMSTPMPAQTDVSDGPTAGGEEGPQDEICVARYPDGTYSVYLEDGQAPPGGAGELAAPPPGQSPMAGMAEGAEREGGRGERLESLELALKAVVKLDRERPIGETGAEQFGDAFKQSAQSAGY